MGTVLAVKKKGTICIAADSLTISAGGRKETAEHVTGCEKIICAGSSYVGIASHPAWPLVLQSFFSAGNSQKPLKTRAQVFSVLLELHQELKESFFSVSCGRRGG